MRDDFAIFILSHGRANNVKTVATIQRENYTGRWYIICDDEDEQIDSYKVNFGEEHIIIFNREKYVNLTDTFDNFDNRNSIVFARNACFDIAKDLGLNYFWELEDDYNIFRSRFFDGVQLSSYEVMDLDSIIDIAIEFLDESNALTIAFSQTGDLIGGFNSSMFRDRVTRKAMNTFFCKVSKPFKFIGRMNDDVNIYTSLGSQGELFFTLADITLEQCDTQKNKGGNTDMYIKFGTYIKSFYSVMVCPSSVKICDMGQTNRRIHHLVDWERTVPKIISDRFKVKE